MGTIGDPDIGYIQAVNRLSAPGISTEKLATLFLPVSSLQQADQPVAANAVLVSPNALCLLKLIIQVQAKNEYFSSPRPLLLIRFLDIQLAFEYPESGK